MPDTVLYSKVLFLPCRVGLSRILRSAMGGDARAAAASSTSSLVWARRRQRIFIGDERPIHAGDAVAKRLSETGVEYLKVLVK